MTVYAGDVIATRDLTDAERRAVDDIERPGVWRRRDPLLAARAFGRRNDMLDRQVELLGDGFEEHHLSQYETDVLVANELWGSLVGDTLLRDAYRSAHDIERIVGEPTMIAMRVVTATATGMRYASEQRGGIHSDPLVRLLAFRVWGERDRMWGLARERCRALSRATKGGGRRTWLSGSLMEMVDGAIFQEDWFGYSSFCSIRERVECDECGDAIHARVAVEVEDGTAAPVTRLCPRCHRSLRGFDHVSDDDVGTTGAPW